MYELNGIVYSIVKTWAYEGETESDPLNGTMCVRLQSEDARYSIVTEMETLSSFRMI